VCRPDAAVPFNGDSNRGVTSDLSRYSCCCCDDDRLDLGIVDCRSIIPGLAGGGAKRLIKCDRDPAGASVFAVSEASMA
jgi:hypothetical protein